VSTDASTRDGGDSAPAGPPLADLSFSLVGPGKVGASLAHWLVAGGARLDRVLARRLEAARALTATLGGEPRTVDDSHEPRAAVNLLLIAVSDPALDEVAQELARHGWARGTRVALHTAGSRGAEVLAPLSAAGGQAGVAIGSLHPLKAFPTVLPEVAKAAGILFALDGDPAAIELGRRLAATWAARSATVPGSARLLYHFAASLAAGGVVTLLATADRIARLQGLSDEVAAGYLELAQGALDATRQAPSSAEAITGPLARGDLAMVAGQLRALAELDPEALPLCEALALETLRHLGLSPEQRRAAARSLGIGGSGNRNLDHDTP
jgi:predicted short-subunit dehydrogenase-like oxidoreductase (DUF2520 family)